MTTSGAVSTRTYSPGKSSPYPDIELDNYELSSKRCKTAYGESEVRIDGKTSLLLSDSEKYGKEIVFQVYSNCFELMNRKNQSSWNRSELFFDADDLDELIEALQTLKQLKEEKWE